MLVLLAGCLPTRGVDQPTRHYTLEYDPPRVADLARLPNIIQVSAFETAPTYDTTQIVYSEGQYQRETYVYHKWRNKPGEMVTQYLTRDLRESGLFAAVLTEESRSAASHRLEGVVEEFYELDSAHQWFAVLTLDVVLAAADESDPAKRVLLQKSYSLREPCKEKTPLALAAAMSRALAKASSRIVVDIHGRLVGEK